MATTVKVEYSQRLRPQPGHYIMSIIIIILLK